VTGSPPKPKHPRTVYLSRQSSSSTGIQLSRRTKFTLYISLPN
jgi:hypothetical protein